MAGSYPMKLAFLYNGQSVEITAQQHDGSWRITLPGEMTRTIVLRQEAAEEGFVAFEEQAEPESTTDCTIYNLPVAKTPRGLEVAFKGRAYVFEEPKSIASKHKPSRASSGSLVAPMV